MAAPCHPNPPTETTGLTTQAAEALAALAASASTLAQQLLANPGLDPQTLAAAIERLTLAQTLNILAQPHSAPQDRANALHAFHQWRQADLARQRLELERQKIELARQRLAAQSPSPSDPLPPEPYSQEEAEKIILDQLDQILGLKPRNPNTISPPPPDPPPPPAPP